jgi:hypothetical protein
MTPGVYWLSIDVGRDTNITVYGLRPTNTHYFVSTAYNDTGYESDRSNEVSTHLIPPPNQQEPLRTIRFKGLINKSLTLPVGPDEGDYKPVYYRIILAPLHGYLDGQWGGLTYLPESDFTGADSFLLAVVYPDSSEILVPFEGIIQASYPAPVAANTCVRLVQPIAGQDYYPLALGGWNPERTELQARITQQPHYGEIIGKMPSLFYRPRPDFPGNDLFAFVLTDGLTDSAPAWCQVMSPDAKATRSLEKFQVFTQETNALKIEMTGEAAGSSVLLLVKSSDLRHWDVAADALPALELRYSELMPFGELAWFYRFQLQSFFSIGSPTLNSCFRPGQGQSAFGFLLKKIRPGFQMVVNPFLDDSDFSWQVVHGSPKELMRYPLVDLTAKPHDLVALDPDSARQIFPPNELVYIENSSEQDAWIVFWGQLEKGSRTNSLTVGFSIQASPFPVSGLLNSELRFPAEHGDQIFILNSAGKTRKRFLFRDSGWDPVPVLRPGEAFVLITARPRTWIQEWD